MSNWSIACWSFIALQIVGLCLQFSSIAPVLGTFMAVGLWFPSMYCIHKEASRSETHRHK